MDTWPEGYIELLRRRDSAYCNERNLVLRALGVDAHVLYDSGVYVLVVPQEHALRSAAELSQYDAEDKTPPAKLTPLPLRGSGLAGLGGYVTCLLLVAIFQNQHALSHDWLAIGALDVARVHQGEWWRLVTALTLHLDTAHLMGNLVVGGIFGFFLGRLLGDGMAWFCIVLAAVTGNAMDAVVQQSYFSAAGASTAVFAALGLLCGYSWRMRNSSQLRWAARWAPLVGGVALLAWLGTGDEHTDVVAHLTGFIAGTTLGTALPMIGMVQRAGPRSQLALGALGIAIVTAAWLFALAGP